MDDYDFETCRIIFEPFLLINTTFWCEISFFDDPLRSILIPLLFFIENNNLVNYNTFIHFPAVKYCGLFLLIYLSIFS